MVINLIHNIALLIALSTFYGLFLQKLHGQEKLFRITIGVWFGLAAIAGMLSPFNYAEGIFFDGRSVILALSGLFGGWIPALISAAIAGSYRIMVGGAGVFVGVSTIVLCSVTGVLFRHYFKNKAYKLTLLQYLFIGLIVHVVMLGSQLLFPWPIGIEIIKQIWQPILLVFPATFMIIGALLGREENRIIGNKELSFSEKRFRTTLYSIGDAVITTDKGGNITLMNTIAEQLTGYSEKEAIGMALEKVFVIINEHSRNKVESPVEKVLQSGCIVGLANHTLLVAKNGDEIPIADSGAPIEDEDGLIVGVVLVFRDQIEQHLQQSLLEASEIKYRELVESTDAIAWEYDIIHDAFIYVAPQVTDKTGWRPEEWTNMEFWKQNIHPSDRESTCQHMATCTPESPRQTLEYRFKKKTGEYLWVRDLVTVETLNNQPVKLRGVILDINTLKNNELKLKEQQFFLHETQKIGRIGTYHLNIQKDKWTSSPIMNDIFGLDEDCDKTFESWNKLVHPEQQTEMMSYFINTVVREHIPFNKEYKIIRFNDGKERWVHGHGQLTYDDAGNAVSMIGTIQDITEKQQLLQDIMAAKEKAEENDRLKSAFLANMSHEIRTPLNGILGFTGLITGDELPPKSRRMEYSAIIHRSAESLMQLINDILELSKLDAGQFSIENQEFKLSDTLKSLHTLYRKKLEDFNKHKIQLALSIDNDHLFMTGDETRLTQVLTNLLDNALKFTEEGEISFGINKIADNIVLYVSDTGIGIDQSKQEIIFDRFSQADETISRYYGGTGLGLSIVKVLIELMGGRITVESEPGKGSLFEIHLPNTTRTVVSSQVEIKEESATVSKRLKILLVEDDPISRMYYEAILTDDLIELIIAPTGTLALELAKKEKPNVILLDIRLPDISGLEVARQIRNSGNKVKIIAQSAYAMPGDEQAAIEAGCNDYLTKPVKANLLLEKLKAIV